MQAPKIITAIDDLPDTLWYPQQGSKNITDLYRGQPVAESIAPKDLRPEELFNILGDLTGKETPLYERLPGGTGASLEHWQQIEIRLERTVAAQEQSPEDQTVQSRKMYFLRTANNPASPDFHYTDEARIRENASKDAGNQLAQQIAVIEKKSESLEEKVFEVLKGEFGRQDIRRVLAAVIGQSLTIGQVYKALLPQLVAGRAVIGCEVIDPGEIAAPAEQTSLTSEAGTQEAWNDSASPHEETAEERRQAKIASIHEKIKEIQRRGSHRREKPEEEQRQAKIAYARTVIHRLGDMNFQQAEVLIYGDFLITKDDTGAFVLSYEHPLSEHIDRPIRIVTMGIKNLLPSHAREYEKNIGKYKSLNIYGQVVQPLNLDKEVCDIVVNPYAIY